MKVRARGLSYRGERRGQEMRKVQTRGFSYWAPLGAPQNGRRRDWHQSTRACALYKEKQRAKAEPHLDVVPESRDHARASPEPAMRGRALGSSADLPVVLPQPPREVVGGTHVGRALAPRGEEDVAHPRPRQLLAGRHRVWMLRRAAGSERGDAPFANVLSSLRAGGR